MSALFDQIRSGALESALQGQHDPQAIAEYLPHLLQQLRDADTTRGGDIVDRLLEVAVSVPQHHTCQLIKNIASRICAPKHANHHSDLSH
jgi:hypothetical protein